MWMVFTHHPNLWIKEIPGVSCVKSPVSRWDPAIFRGSSTEHDVQGKKKIENFQLLGGSATSGTTSGRLLTSRFELTPVPSIWQISQELEIW